MIGIFDSGIGGVTVFREIINKIPNGHFVYYSDSINNPYGDKPKDELINIVDNIVNKLINFGVKVIVIACNTASYVCKDYLRNKYKNIIFIAIEPAYKMVYDYNFAGKTLVMATKGTIENEKFLSLYHKYDNHNTILLSCVGLADLIEQGKDVRNYLKKVFSNIKDIENVVLGCTHYPLIKEEISNILGSVKFYDGSLGVTKELIKQLDSHNIKYSFAKLDVKFIDSSGNKENEERFYKILFKN